MYISVLIYIGNVIITHSYVLKDTNNLLFKDGVHYKVDLVINDDDYEMIDKNDVKIFTVNNEDFYDFDNMVRYEYDKDKIETSINTLNLYIDMDIATRPMRAVTINNVKSTNTRPLSTDPNPRTERKDEVIYEMEYNYNDLLNEYYEQANEDVVKLSETQDYGIVNSLKILFLPLNENNNYNKTIGLQTIKTLMEDYQKQRHLTTDMVIQVWKVAQIWFLVYLVIALPLWCTRGWCCCCLFCKFFKPRQTIEEAKKFLITNPPGVFHTKNEVVLYTPTAREIETYEEFEHFIKTL